MVLVRLVFHAKFGKAADVVKGMKEMAAGAQAGGGRARHVRILTDLSGRFDTVVEELEYDGIGDFLQDLADMANAPNDQGGGMGGLELMEGGYKEYYTVEYEQ